MTHYHTEQTKVVDYSTDGRMSIGEVISLLSHLNNDYQRPWIDSFHYRYDSIGNKSYLSLTTMNDRPHNVMAGTTTSGESGSAARGSARSDKD